MRVISWKITGAPTTLFQDIGEDPVPNAQFSWAIILWYEMSILGRQNRQLTSFGEQPDAEGTPGAGRLPLNVLALVVVCLGSSY